MGLFNFLKRQMLEVIEWEDSSKDTIVYRYPLDEREEIMNSSTLIVRPSQVALFVHKGDICDIFAPGSYKLTTENIPVLTKLLSLPTGFNSPIKAEVYFVNTKQFSGNKWGTQNPIMMRDADFGSIRLRGYGVYSFRVQDAKLFMHEMFGTNELYTVEDVSDHIKPLIINGVTDAVAESKMSALDLASNYREFGKTVVEYSQPEFEKIGLKLESCTIENLSLPEEVEKVLDERTRLGVLEDKVGTYTKLKAADALGDAAKNPGGLAGLGVGLGAGASLGNVFAGNLDMQNPVKQQAPAAPVAPVQMVACTNCGASIKAGAKFCSECGTKQESGFCPSCGAKVGPNAKFCAECGEKLK